MVNIDRFNRTSFNTLQKTTRDQEVAEAWQKQNKNPEKTISLNAKKQLAELQSKQQAKQASAMMQTSKVNRIKAVDAVDQIDDIDQTQGIEGHYQSSIVNFDDAGRFDLQNDISDFVRPQNLDSALLHKDNMSQVAQKILLHLELGDSSDALIKRATALFQEEQNVKSVVSAYKNALVFA